MGGLEAKPCHNLFPQVKFVLDAEYVTITCLPVYLESFKLLVLVMTIQCFVPILFFAFMSSVTNRQNSSQDYASVKSSLAPQLCIDTGKMYTGCGPNAAIFYLYAVFWDQSSTDGDSKMTQTQSLEIFLLQRGEL